MKSFRSFTIKGFFSRVTSLYFLAASLLSKLRLPLALLRLTGGDPLGLLESLLGEGLPSLALGLSEEPKSAVAAEETPRAAKRQKPLPALLDNLGDAALVLSVSYVVYDLSGAGVVGPAVPLVFWAVGSVLKGAAIVVRATN